VGFIKEMEEILYMMMMFQKIIYRGQDLAEKVAIEIFKKGLCRGVAMESCYGLTVRKKRGDG
jgi:hypothetical protein